MGTLKCTELKVSKTRKQIALSSREFSQKMNKWIQLYYKDTSGWLVFFVFWKKLKTPKRHFEINFKTLARLKKLLKSYCPDCPNTSKTANPFRKFGHSTISLCISVYMYEVCYLNLISLLFGGCPYLTQRKVGTPQSETTKRKVAVRLLVCNVTKV